MPLPYRVAKRLIYEMDNVIAKNIININYYYMFCYYQGNSMTTDKTYSRCSAVGLLDQCFSHLITAILGNEKSSLAFLWVITSVTR